MQIYKITNIINGKIYIGKDESNRKNYFGSGKLIKRSISKYGIENHTKEIIEEIQDRNLLQEREKFWINEYRSYDRNIGYNISFGGDGGDTISNNPNREIIIQKISSSMKKRTFSPEHLLALKENHPKLKMSEKNMDVDSWLKNIKKAHSKRKGKKLHEILGEEKANEVKAILKQRRQEISERFKVRVGKFSLEGDLLAIYDSQTEASIHENIRKTDISNCIRGRQKTVKGFIWKKF